MTILVALYGEKANLYFLKALASLSNFGSITELVTIEHKTTKWRLFKTKNEVIKYFLESDEFDFLCLVNSTVHFNQNIVCRGAVDLYSAFLQSYKYNKLPLQIAVPKLAETPFSEDPYVYHSKIAQTDCIFVAKDAVQKVGYLDKDECLILWMSRINAAIGRYPEDYVYMKYAYRYVVRQFDRQHTFKYPESFNKGRLQEIYEGKDLCLNC